MDSDKAQELFLSHAPCMAYIAVRNADGDEGIGSAFHVGEGIFVTARHVVEGLEIIDIKPTHVLRLPLKEAVPETTDETIKSATEMYGQAPTWPVFQNSLRLTKGPFFHSDAEIDVAVFGTEGLHPKTPYVKLGRHLDDWIVRTNFVLSELVVLGYPPIPLTREANLIAARAEVNAVVIVAPSSKSHFVVSAIPRGGFSGGLALSEYDFALGLVSSSLTKNHQAAEFGFMAVISVEPIYECLALHKLLPECQKVGWNDFWNTDEWDFVVQRDRLGWELMASVSLYNDGKRLYVGLYCRERSAMDRCLEALAQHPEGNEVTYTSDMHARFTFTSDHDEALAAARKVVTFACEALADFGYQPGPLHGTPKSA
ncbi:hypothetical protein [Bradyrhizobium sp. 27S5]|uniref:hypothetical protein n=1 Tax=Bradyrhizobium sp. 27S5 TaxID=3139728 RepID=UPI0030D50642